MYTSGSTGMPKGVAMPHSPLVNLIYWQQENTRLDSPARTLQFSPLFFDVSCQELSFTWSSGDTLILISEELRQDPVILLEILRQNWVERIFLPFIALQQLSQAAERLGKNSITGLCEVITAGEQLQITAPIERFFDGLDSCILHNQYGPTESHVVSSFTLNGKPISWKRLPPIGRPISNVHIYILDSHCQLVPIGMSGELYIGGDVLARGYINRPELTAEVFIPDPFTTKIGGRMYKTGDMARFRHDGNIEFLGRIDNQVKIRGYRVELGEIEMILRCSPSVKEAAVVVRDDRTSDKQLVAYLILDDEYELDVRKIRKFLQDRLPNYMLPNHLVVVKSFPLTPSGKLNRQALPPLQGERPKLGDPFVAPRNSIDAKLADIWMDGMLKEFRVELPLRAIFEMPTIAELSLKISDALNSCTLTETIMSAEGYEEVDL
jgi:amino acid adenylation domain-containing protein